MPQDDSISVTCLHRGEWNDRVVVNFEDDVLEVLPQLRPIKVFTGDRNTELYVKTVGSDETTILQRTRLENGEAWYKLKPKSN